jgi:hypothetical protein
MFGGRVELRTFKKRPELTARVWTATIRDRQTIDAYRRNALSRSVSLIGPLSMRDVESSQYIQLAAWILEGLAIWNLPVFGLNLPYALQMLVLQVVGSATNCKGLD